MYTKKMMLKKKRKKKNMRPWISGAMLMKSTDRNAFVSILIGSTLTLEITDVFRHITEKTT